MFGFSSFGGAAARSAAPGISASEAVELAKKGEITVIDVRGHNEVASSGKAAEAIHIPLMLMQSQADPRHPEFNKAIDKEKPVAVYCASGARSSAAVGMLRQFGFDKVHNIGGLGDWMAAGGRISM